GRGVPTTRPGPGQMPTELPPSRHRPRSQQPTEVEGVDSPSSRFVAVVCLVDDRDVPADGVVIGAAASKGSRVEEVHCVKCANEVKWRPRTIDERVVDFLLRCLPIVSAAVAKIVVMWLADTPVIVFVVSVPEVPIEQPHVVTRHSAGSGLALKVVVPISPTVSAAVHRVPRITPLRTAATGPPDLGGRVLHPPRHVVARTKAVEERGTGHADSQVVDLVRVL